MSAFGGKADINQQSSEGPLIANSGHCVFHIRATILLRKLPRAPQPAALLPAPGDDLLGDVEKGAHDPDAAALGEEHQVLGHLQFLGPDRDLHQARIVPGVGRRHDGDAEVGGDPIAGRLPIEDVHDVGGEKSVALHRNLPATSVLIRAKSVQFVPVVFTGPLGGRRRSTVLRRVY